MTKRYFLSLTGIFSFLCMTAVYAGQAKPPAAAAASPESLTNGAALYKRQCVMCHGAAGLGDGPAAKSLKGKLPSLADKATMSKLTDAQLRQAFIAAGATDREAEDFAAEVHKRFVAIKTAVEKS